MLSMHMTENQEPVAGVVAFCMAPDSGSDDERDRVAGGHYLLRCAVFRG
jgi:hypothetical protein